MRKFTPTSPLQQAIRDVVAELEAGESLEGLFKRVADEHGVRPELLARKFGEAHGDPATLRERQQWAQRSRGWVGSKFVLQGHEYRFVRLVDSATLVATHAATGQIHEFVWPEVNVLLYPQLDAAAGRDD